MTTRQTLARIRKLLASPERDSVRQGIELIETLEDPEVSQPLASGITFTSEHEISWGYSSEVQRRVKKPHQLWAAIGLMRATGKLDAVEAFKLPTRTHTPTAADLEYLAGLEGLRSLSLPNAYRMEDLDFLEGLPGLRKLEVTNGRALRDVSALGGLAELEDLRLAYCYNLTDFSSLARLRGLKCLHVSGSGARELSWLAGLVELTELSLGGLRNLQDLSPLAGLTALTKLTLSGNGGMPDVSALAGLTALTTLTISGSTAISFRPLAGLTALTTLSLSGSRNLNDLTPLAGLTNLETLYASSCPELSDLTPLAGLTNLQRLSVQRCAKLTDLSPLAGLTNLRRLSWQRSGVTDLSPLEGLTSLADDVTIDDQGRPRLDKRILNGEELLTVLLPLASLPAAHPLRGATQIALSHCNHLTALPQLGELTALKQLTLNSCPALVDLSPIVAMDELETLALGQSDAVRPRPERRSIEGREAVARYQRKVARRLSRKHERSPAEEAWLAHASGAGLLERAADHQRQENAPSVTAIRKLLSSRDIADAIQGYELLRALDDPAIVAEFADGVTLTESGHMQISAAATRRSHMRSLDRRIWGALAVLRATGALEQATALIYNPYRRGRKSPLNDLTPLDGLDGLEKLTFSYISAQDLSPLGSLTGLKELSLTDCTYLTDLSVLQGLEHLESIRLTRCRSLRDISGVRHLPALRYLYLSRCSNVTDQPHYLQDRAAVERFVAGLD